MTPRRGKTRAINKDLYDRLDHRFSYPDWYTVYEVSMIAGEDELGDGKWRQADAFAVSTWASRSWEIHGIEVKATRSDWLAELREPAKADAAIRVCRKWWLLSPEGVVEPGELPEGWGHLVPSGTGLRAAVEATPRQPEDPPRRFWMHVLRRMFNQETVARRVRAAYATGERAGRQGSTWRIEQQLKRAVEDLEDNKRGIATFEKASGIKFSPWDAGEIGAAVKVILQGRDVVGVLANMGGSLRRELDRMDEAVKAARAEAGNPTT